MATGRSAATADPADDTGALATDQDTSNEQNAAPEPEAATAGKSASGEYRVLTHSLVMALDKEGKKTQRFMRGQRIKPGDHVDVDHLLALRAIEPFGTRKDSIGPTNAEHVARAANAANQENEPLFLDDGEPEDVTGEDANA